MLKNIAWVKIFVWPPRKVHNTDFFDILYEDEKRKNGGNIWERCHVTRMRWGKHLKTNTHTLQQGQKGNGRLELHVRTQNSPTPDNHAPLWYHHWKKMQLSVSGELSLAWQGWIQEAWGAFKWGGGGGWAGIYIKRRVYTKAEPRTCDSGMNIKDQHRHKRRNED